MTASIETQVTAAVESTRPVRRHRRARPGQIVSGVLLMLVTVVILLPVIFMLVSSLKDNVQIGSHPLSLPSPVQWRNYATVFSQMNYLQSVANTVIIVVLSVALTIACGSTVAWVIVRRARRWTALVYRMLIAGLTIPIFVITTPLYLLMRDFHLLNTYASAILIYAALNLPFSVLFFVSFMKGIPEELEDAAVVDGAGPFRTFWSVVLPLATPATATISIFVALTVWNDVVVPLVFLSSSNLQTVTLSMFSFVGTQGQVTASQLFPAVVLATAPLIIAFVILQRWIIAGITAGVGRV